MVRVLGQDMRDVHSIQGGHTFTTVDDTGSIRDAMPIRAQCDDRPARSHIGCVPAKVYLPKQATGQIWLVAHSVLILLYEGDYCFAISLSSPIRQVRKTKLGAVYLFPALKQWII